MARSVTKSDGFTAVEALLVLFVIAIVGFAGWYVWQGNKSTKSNTTDTKSQVVVYKKSTTVPANWKTYSDTKDGVQFAYPADSHVDAAGPSKSWKSTPFNPENDIYNYGKVAMDYSLVKNSEPAQGASYGSIVLLNQAAAASVAQYKQYVAAYNKQWVGQIRENVAVRAEKFDGNKLLIVTNTTTYKAQDSKTTTGTSEKYYYLEHSGKTLYINISELPSGVSDREDASSRVSAKDALTIFESIKFTGAS